jgi:hypothetical protein
VYIGDLGGFSVRLVTTDGIIHTIARGNPVDPFAYNWGFTGFGGEGGPAIGADYGLLYGLALDGSGNVYLLDNTNERIRVLTPGAL